MPPPSPHTLPHPGHLLTRLISIRAFLKRFPHGLSEFQQNWEKKGELQLNEGGRTRNGCHARSLHYECPRSPAAVSGRCCALQPLLIPETGRALHLRAPAAFLLGPRSATRKTSSGPEGHWFPDAPPNLLPSSEKIEESGSCECVWCKNIITSLMFETGRR